jgi:hypothetical protein
MTVIHFLWICGRPWRVEFSSDPVTSSGKVVLGDCQEDTLLIRVSVTGVSRQQQRSTLLHEALHACLKTNVPPDPLPSDAEECYVRSLEVTLYDLLRDNRNEWFRQFMLEPDELLIPFVM